MVKIWGILSDKIKGLIESMDAADLAKAWYKNRAVICGLLVVFPPVGIFLWQRYSRVGKDTKQIVTGVASVWLLFCIICGIGIGGGASDETKATIADARNKLTVSEPKATLPETQTNAGIKQKANEDAELEAKQKIAEQEDREEKERIAAAEEAEQERVALAEKEAAEAEKARIALAEKEAQKAEQERIALAEKEAAEQQVRAAEAEKAAQKAAVKQDSQETGHTVYVTPTGKKYHYNGNCNGGKYSESTLASAKARGLSPCKKCT